MARASRGFQPRTPRVSSPGPVAYNGFDPSGVQAYQKNALEDEKLHQELIDKAMKNVGDESLTLAKYGDTQPNINAALLSSGTTGQANPQGMSSPAARLFAKKPMTAEMIKTVMTQKPTKEAADKDRTQEGIAYALAHPLTHDIQVGKNADGSYITKTVPYSPEEIKTNAMGMIMKKGGTFDPEDPGWNKINERFAQPAATPPPAEKPSNFMESSGANAVGRFLNKFNPLASPSTPAPTPTPTPAKNPYADHYPNAFQEDGVWKVMQGGQKFRIED